MTHNLKPAEQEAFDLVEAYRKANPKIAYDKAARAVGVNLATYYAARRALGIPGKLETVDAIKLGAAILTAKTKRRWNIASLCWENA